MLCLSVKANEPVGIGEMLVTIQGKPGQSFRVLYDGPRTIPVVRTNAKSKEPKPRKDNQC